LWEDPAPGSPWLPRQWCDKVSGRLYRCLATFQLFELKDPEGSTPEKLCWSAEEFSEFYDSYTRADPAAIVAAKDWVTSGPDGRVSRVSCCVLVVLTEPVTAVLGSQPPYNVVLLPSAPDMASLSRVEDAVAEFDRRCPGAQRLGDWDVALAALRRHVSEPGPGDGVPSVVVAAELDRMMPVCRYLDLLDVPKKVRKARGRPVLRIRRGRRGRPSNSS